ncbi:hypothetical protein MKEN_00602600 [Mycena kentingensis (nom. inval.)]|nr:hypothetical protein MKEN_00602600 [Mycena kentingensis (nom. inval.)]
MAAQTGPAREAQSTLVAAMALHTLLVPHPKPTLQHLPRTQPSPMITLKTSLPLVAYSPTLVSGVPASPPLASSRQSKYMPDMPSKTLIPVAFLFVATPPSSTTLHCPTPFLLLLPPPPTEALQTDPAAPQTVSPPEHPAYLAIINAKRALDPALVAAAVRDLVTNVEDPSVRLYNAALEALRETRRPGEPLTLLMQTYNAMLSHNLLPNLRTYFELLTAVTDRDHEIHSTIIALEARARRGQATTTDAQRISSLQAENTFDSIIKLYDTVVAGTVNPRIPLYIYVAILRSCANHARRDIAVNILAAIEQRSDIKPVASVFRHVLRAFASPESIADAEMIFNDYIQRSANNEIDWTVAYNDPNGPRRQHLQVWNQMIESYFRAGLSDKAIEILQRMLQSTAPAAFGPSDVPRPASSTYTVTIAGFVESNDIDTALDWFKRLLAQTERPRQPYESALAVLRPDAVAWQYMLDGLAFAGRREDLNAMFVALQECAAKDGLRVRQADREMVYLVNVYALSELSDEAAIQAARFLETEVLQPEMDPVRLLRPFWTHFIRRGLLEDALALVGRIDGGNRTTGHPVSALIREVLKKDVPFDYARRLVLLAEQNRLSIGTSSASVLHAYGLDKQRGVNVVANLDAVMWAWLLNAAVEQEIVPSHRPNEYAFQGLVALLEDMAQTGQDFLAVDPALRRRIVRSVFVKHGAAGVKDLFYRLGPSFDAAVAESGVVVEPVEEETSDASSVLSESASDADTTSELATSVSDVEPVPQIAYDQALSSEIEDILTFVPGPVNRYDGHAIKAQELFLAGLVRGLTPGAFTVGKIIQLLGRVGQLERVRDTYTAAQTLLRALEHDKPVQSNAWFAIENSMIIALAHAGDLEGAHVHRSRMLEMGGAPTADAYGVLILYVKDTTDDTSNAIALFQEAQARHVVPNQYLYNNIISKLAKARKADYALELFEQMKHNGYMKPSSVTYGAVLGACARVGDVISAETLFDEMTQAGNYRPRIPPFNTMIQLYVSTKPNRERALYYYNKMLAAKIAPSAHTYKLLLDAYGRIEPVDFVGMEQVRQALQADKHVEMQSSHFASLIHAYGCVGKDLDRAVNIFNSIPTLPRAPLRDAVVFESMINALVATRRADLMPHYIALMRREGVHMTAYIANFLIKGYADAGHLAQARDVFEALVDPPSGVAAAYNHAPHEPSAAVPIDPLEPVYREPSTWEAMRLKERCYPDAVFQRISGILVDHSIPQI